MREEVKEVVCGSAGKIHVDEMVQIPLYNISEVRDLFRNVSRSTICEWFEQGLLKPAKPSGKVNF